MKTIVQVALDLLEIDRAVQIAKEALEGGVDWIEVGTPLIKSEGMSAIRRIRKEFPGYTVLADMKTIDTGSIEVEMAAKSGADIVMILGGSDNSTIDDSVRSAHQYGVKLMADLMSVNDPVERAIQLEKMGIDYINVHVGIDQQMQGYDPIYLLKDVVDAVNVPVAVAGGIDEQRSSEIVNTGADIVIVGGNITRSDNVSRAAKTIRSSVDSPSKFQVSKQSLDDEIYELLTSTSTPNISDAMHRKGAMRKIIPLVQDTKMVGKAVTVQTFEGDWAKPVQAIDIAKPGDVIVIYNSSKDIACWGGLATFSCLNKGIAGVVVDGAVRDVDDITNIGLPIFAGNTVPNAGDPKGFGEINSEITCGSQNVRPGDYIVGDNNGVVVVPKERAYEIARRSKEIEKGEQRLYDEVKRGRTLSDIAQLNKWEKQ
ncbi:Dimethylmenaquinone methyltransferase [Methanohalobium evestigatum Z-7303]|uniref:3-hexulose-6-phosphate synthase n=1 Tax=Methanohalobium evestigatum (strain ATCC BAA-1072 / DSM 3721 / NBRC 107634 / OCM 161 / Z-7303) TaxID=644295 RepID=D7E6X5_METEZ|nr:Dimethylmenaquinone methyltransferase [Methanohalobium evestigatum Z-7303]